MTETVAVKTMQELNMEFIAELRKKVDEGKPLYPGERNILRVDDNIRDTEAARLQPRQPCQPRPKVRLALLPELPALTRYADEISGGKWAIATEEVNGNVVDLHLVATWLDGAYDTDQWFCLDLSRVTSLSAAKTLIRLQWGGRYGPSLPG